MLLTLTTRTREKIKARTTIEHQQVPCNTYNYLFRGLSKTPLFFSGQIMSSIALVLFGFIVIYAIVIVAAAFADDFFRKNKSR